MRVQICISRGGQSTNSRRRYLDPKAIGGSGRKAEGMMVQQCSMAGEVAWCECQYQATEDAFPDAKRKAGLCAESKLYIVSVVEQYEGMHMQTGTVGQLMPG